MATSSYSISVSPSSQVEVFNCPLKIELEEGITLSP